MTAKICGNVFHKTHAFVNVKKTQPQMSTKIQIKAIVQNGGHRISGKKNLENNSKKNTQQGTIHVNVVWQYPTQQQTRVLGTL